ncbi:hypothetical protein PPSIR1_35462 [Plesiocystis pacifica SIR-1]|uniref:Uncharacterized protein n=1 Tax=Plesiocystis pacifica SIR-1 TaxID=391625 RepID=A6GHB9_9BACT|nr:hypothetical protein PPSIR1_35462 [Plesiocystis pacifica SIR-1]
MAAAQLVAEATEQAGAYQYGVAVVLCGDGDMQREWFALVRGHGSLGIRQRRCHDA